MDHKQERVKELWELGFGCHVIAKNLNEQGVYTSELEVASIVGLQISEQGQVLYKYEVNESRFNSQTSEQVKNRMYVIAEMLSVGHSKQEICKKLKVHKANLLRDIDKYIVIGR